MSKITPSQPTGLTHTDTVILKKIICVPVWNKEEILLFDIFTIEDGAWIGSKRLLRYCEEVDLSYACI